MLLRYCAVIFIARLSKQTLIRAPIWFHNYLPLAFQGSLTSHNVSLSLSAVPDFMIPPECPELDLITHLPSSNTSATLAQTTERGKCDSFLYQTSLIIPSSRHPCMTSDLPLSCLCPHSASPSPHRSPYKASPSRAERRKTSSTSGPSEEARGAATTPKTPQVSPVVTSAIYCVLRFLDSDYSAGHKPPRRRSPSNCIALISVFTASELFVQICKLPHQCTDQ